MHKRIVVDISRAVELEKTGIHNYQMHLFNNLLAIDNKNEFLPLYYSSKKTTTKFFSEKEIILLQNPFLKRNAFLKEIFDRYFIRKRLKTLKLSLLHATAYDIINGIEDKTILTVHDLVLCRNQYNPNSYFRKVLLRALQTVRAIIAISETTKMEILNEFPKINYEKIKVIYQGIDDSLNKVTDIDALQKFKKEFFGVEKIKYILYLGSFNKRKNILNLIKAYQILRNSGIEQKLVLTGKIMDMQIYEHLFEYVHKNNLQNEIIIKTYFPQNMISLLYSAADVFVFPSTYEGFGLPVLEAMRCGSPCVVSNVSSLRELFSDSAFMVDPMEVNSIANGIFRLLSEKSLRESLITAGYLKASGLTWQKTALETLKIYNLVINGEL